MNSAAIAEFVALWAIVNVAALAMLAALSYFGSVLILDGLHALDRGWCKLEHKQPVKHLPDQEP